MNRDVSDHYLIVLRYANLNWGRKPFRYKNFWLKNEEFVEVVKGSWAGFDVIGWWGFVIEQKLKMLKTVLKSWNAQVFGDMDSKIKVLK